MSKIVCVRGAVEVGRAQHLDDVGDRVLAQQHAAEHRLLGRDVLRRGALELGRDRRACAAWFGSSTTRSLTGVPPARPAPRCAVHRGPVYRPPPTVRARRAGRSGPPVDAAVERVGTRHAVGGCRCGRRSAAARMWAVAARGMPRRGHAGIVRQTLPPDAQARSGAAHEPEVRTPRRGRACQRGRAARRAPRRTPAREARRRARPPQGTGPRGVREVTTGRRRRRRVRVASTSGCTLTVTVCAPSALIGCDGAAGACRASDRRPGDRLDDVGRW